MVQDNLFTPEQSMEAAVRKHISSPAMITSLVFYSLAWAGVIAFRMLAELKMLNHPVFEKHTASTLIAVAVGLLVFIAVFLPPSLYMTSKSDRLESGTVNRNHIFASFLYDDPQAGLFNSMTNYTRALGTSLELQKGEDPTEIGPANAIKQLKKGVKSADNYCQERYAVVTNAACVLVVLSVSSAFIAAVPSIKGIQAGTSTISTWYTGALIIIPAILSCLALGFGWASANCLEAQDVTLKRSQFLDSVDMFPGSSISMVPGGHMIARIGNAASKHY